MIVAGDFNTAVHFQLLCSMKEPGDFFTMLCDTIVLRTCVEWNDDGSSSRTKATRHQGCEEGVLNIVAHSHDDGKLIVAVGVD